MGLVLKRLSFCVLMSAFACGTNTDQPVFPIYNILSTVGAPAIISVEPKESITTDFKTKVEFELKYYITNGETNFIGYNLYITNTSSSAEAALTGLSGEPYLPEGIIPSFSHLGQNPNTANLITQNIDFYKPPPGQQSFEICEKYFFRMTAVVRSGSQSPPSPEVSACAAEDIDSCPANSTCKN